MKKRNNFFACHPEKSWEAVYINLDHIVAVRPRSIILNTNVPGLKEIFLNDYELKKIKRLLELYPDGYPR